MNASSGARLNLTDQRLKLKASDGKAVVVQKIKITVGADQPIVADCLTDSDPKVGHCKLTLRTVDAPP